jgi:hypothetical protein
MAGIETQETDLGRADEQRNGFDDRTHSMDPRTAYSRLSKTRRRGRGGRIERRKGSGGKIKAIHSDATQLGRGVSSVQGSNKVGGKGSFV